MRVATTTTSTAEGGYVISGLDPGTYFVRTNGSFVVLFGNLWYHGVCAACPGAHPTPVTVTSGATASSIDFALPFNPGGISGSLALSRLTPGISSVVALVY